MHYITTYIGAFVAMIILDGLWLGYVARALYVKEIGHLLATSPNWYAAALFYPLFCLGVVYFAVLPNVEAGAVRVMLQAALLGALCYATYDLTNLATLKDWSLTVTIIDILWGAVISSLTALAGYVAYGIFK